MDAVLPVAAVPEKGEPRGMTMETGGLTCDVGRERAGGGSQTALRQVAGIFEKAADMKGWCAADGTAFQSSKATGEQAQGICAASGRLSEQRTIEIEIDLVHAPETVSIHLGFLMRHFAVLVERARMLPSKPLPGGMCALRFGVSVMAVPLSPGREAALFDQIKAFDAAARSLQQRISPSVDRGSLKTQYKDFAGVLDPVQPLGIDPLSIDPSVDLFIKDVIELLDTGFTVAVAAPFPSEMACALACLARAHLEKGISLGMVVIPAVPPKALLELLAKAPGRMVVSSDRVCLGTNPYDRPGEMKGFLGSLSAAGSPMIFTGSMEELQAVFHGGQGARPDPLRPVVMPAPEMSTSIVARAAVEAAAQIVGGLTVDAITELTERVAHLMAKYTPSEQKRCLPPLALMAVRAWSSGRAHAFDRGDEFVQKLLDRDVTLAGLGQRSLAARRPKVQERLVTTLSDPGLLDYLAGHIVGQDRALKQLVHRLQTECLTRPAHQPVTYCAQGTPGTGKSQSAVLIARRLNVPFVNIDAASMPDFPTASGQLLGTARGIVMSHQPGRIEQVANHHCGAVIEVSDLDHCPGHVRAFLSDLFLQILETGEAQSATGAVFSCANIIFIFTMNLPAGADETLRRGFGFGNDPSPASVRDRVMSEIRAMLSGAFLSRVGTPILFEPLDGKALEEIVARAVKASLLTASGRLGIPVKDVCLAPSARAALTAWPQAHIVSSGARALLEHGRSLAAEAFLQAHRAGRIRVGGTVFVSGDPGGKLHIDATDPGGEDHGEPSV